jgi:hypothetical protein
MFSSLHAPIKVVCYTLIVVVYQTRRKSFQKLSKSFTDNPIEHVQTHDSVYFNVISVQLSLPLLNCPQLNKSRQKIEFQF